MDYEQFKERIEEDLHQALADHGIDANFSQHHVEKLNASYDALSVTPEGSHIGVNANLSAMFEAIENGQDYNEVVSRTSESIITDIENTPEINVEDLTNYDEMKSKLAMEVVSADRNAEMLENVPHEQMEDMAVVYRLILGQDSEGRSSVLVTNLNCDRKFRDSWFIALALQRVSDTVCLEHALSVIKPRKPSERDNRNPYNRASFRNALREKVDLLLQNNPKDFGEFLKQLQEAGYEIKEGKHTAIRGAGQKRFIRFSSLGEGYKEEDIKKRITGEMEFDPERQKREVFQQRTGGKWKKPDRGFDLLIDINKKMQEGKGKGYERWAKIYNVKQVSKALLFLQEHGIRDYADLDKKATERAARFHELSDSIKAREARLAEIAVLKTQIINYSKTKEVYVAYRKSGYSKKFLEAHREEILLHKAAKEAFDKLEMKQLPKMKELSAEYSQILSEKRKLYEEYREAKKEMMDYQIAKQDIDRFLKIDEEQHQKDQNKTKEQTR